jgi:hypothetical protein
MSMNVSNQRRMAAKLSSDDSDGCWPSSVSPSRAAITALTRSSLAEK